LAAAANKIKERNRKMTKIAMVAALVMGGTVFTATAGARPLQSTPIQVPFAFVAGNQMLPAGAYKIEMLTQSKPGEDAIEILALRGTDTRGYASFIAFLSAGDARSPRLTFRRSVTGAVLTELRVAGKTFRLSPSRHEQASVSTASYYQTVPSEEAAELVTTEQ